MRRWVVVVDGWLVLSRHFTYGGAVRRSVHAGLFFPKHEVRVRKGAAR